MLPIAAAALVVAPLARVAIYVLAPGWRASIGETFETTVDTLATGGLLALLHGRLTASTSYRRLLESPLVATAPIALCALSALRPHIAFSYPLGETLMNLLIAVIVHHAIVRHQSAAGRLLNCRALTAISAISYSLYLWQQPFLNRQGMGIAATFPLNLLLATGCGLVSYRFVEQPFLAWSHRIQNGRRAPSPIESAAGHAYAALN
jgi:peptidoglycan/LPS O-acetylase OafA/YrhL